MLAIVIVISLCETIQFFSKPMSVPTTDCW